MAPRRRARGRQPAELALPATEVEHAVPSPTPLRRQPPPRPESMGRPQLRPPGRSSAPWIAALVLIPALPQIRSVDPASSGKARDHGQSDGSLRPSLGSRERARRDPEDEEAPCSVEWTARGSGLMILALEKPGQHRADRRGGEDTTAKLTARPRAAAAEAQPVVAAATAPALKPPANSPATARVRQASSVAAVDSAVAPIQSAMPAAANCSEVLGTLARGAHAVDLLGDGRRVHRCAQPPPTATPPGATSGPRGWPRP
jgi:hypothetical protein